MAERRGLKGVGDEHRRAAIEGVAEVLDIARRDPSKLLDAISEVFGASAVMAYAGSVGIFLNALAVTLDSLPPSLRPDVTKTPIEPARATPPAPKAEERRDG